MPSTTPPTATPGHGWQLLGRCGPSTAELFFAPAHREPPAVQAARVAQAKALCRRCPVLLTCRAYAIATGEPHGIWGAMTEAERRRATQPTQRPTRGDAA